MMCDESTVGACPATCVDGVNHPVDHDIGGTVATSTQVATVKLLRYNDLVTALWVLEHLGSLVHEARRRGGRRGKSLSYRATEHRTGVPFNSIKRFEGRGVSPNLLALIRFVAEQCSPGSAEPS